MVINISVVNRLSAKFLKLTYVMERMKWLLRQFDCYFCVKEWVFFSGFMGEWIGMWDKQTAWTAKRFLDDLFVPRPDSFPVNPEKKTFIPLIYNASNKDPS